MDHQLLLHLLQAAIPLALGTAMISASIMLVRRHRNTAAIRRRMAEINAGSPELTANAGGRSERQGGWRWRRMGHIAGEQRRAA